MFNDNIFPTYVLIEFDLLLKNKDNNNSTQDIVQKMILNFNYEILKNDNLNITFRKKLNLNKQTH